MSKEKKSVKDLLFDQKYLPRELRDFHDQKDLFKTIDNWISKHPKHESSVEREIPSWIDAHIYTIDYFLRFMAFHGFLLKRTKTKKYVFGDLWAEISAFKKELSDRFNAWRKGEEKSEDFNQ